MANLLVIFSSQTRNLLFQRQLSRIVLLWSKIVHGQIFRACLQNILSRAVCPRSFGPIYIVILTIWTGQDFLNIRYYILMLYKLLCKYPTLQPSNFHIRNIMKRRMKAGRGPDGEATIDVNRNLNIYFFWPAIQYERYVLPIRW